MRRLSATQNYAELRAVLWRDHVAPGYVAEVQDVIRTRHLWRKAANWAEGLAHGVLGAAAVLSFASGFFTSKYLAFGSACCSTLCFVLFRFGAYAEHESAERHAILSRLLGAAGLDAVPGITADDGPGGPAAPGIPGGPGGLASFTDAQQTPA
jgi:hypothetical protein